MRVHDHLRNALGNAFRPISFAAAAVFLVCLSSQAAPQSTEFLVLDRQDFLGGNMVRFGTDECGNLSTIESLHVRINQARTIVQASVDEPDDGSSPTNAWGAGDGAVFLVDSWILMHPFVAIQTPAVAKWCETGRDAGNWNGQEFINAIYRMRSGTPGLRAAIIV